MLIAFEKLQSEFKRVLLTLGFTVDKGGTMRHHFC